VLFALVTKFLHDIFRRARDEVCVAKLLVDTRDFVLGLLEVFRQPSVL
jgi:hypothetical protein